MTALLSDKETVFDHFLLNEAVIATGNTFTVDGHINREFYSREELEELRLKTSSRGMVFDENLVRWESVKGYCYSCIKGKKVPLSFRMTLCLPPEELEGVVSSSDSSVDPGAVNSLNVNIRYDGGTLTCTTAVSLKIFTTDRSIDRAWDESFEAFLNTHGYDHDTD